jgi:hypothetical protein
MDQPVTKERIIGPLSKRYVPQNSESGPVAREELI